MRSISARPYIWPYHGAPDPTRTALLVFSDACDAVPRPATVQRLNAVVTAARAARIAVIALPPLQAGPVYPLDSLAADLTIRRPHVGAFAGTHLDTELRRRGIAELVIIGLPFELGADCTMREANDRGYECLAIEDCCSALDEQTFAGAVSSVQFSGGIFGAVATAAEVLTALNEEVTSDADPGSGRPISVAVRR